MAAVIFSFLSIILRRRSQIGDNAESGEDEKRQAYEDSHMPEKEEEEDDPRTQDGDLLLVVEERKMGSEALAAPAPALVLLLNLVELLAAGAVQYVCFSVDSGQLVDEFVVDLRGKILWLKYRDIGLIPLTDYFMDGGDEVLVEVHPIDNSL